jgi:hypothetical protein
MPTDNHESKASMFIKRLLFYWANSFTIAVTAYYILSLILPPYLLFGWLIRMFLYHWQYPVPYIAVMCFFYGIIASILAKVFHKARLIKQILLTLLIVVLTTLVSSPFGGMLWHLHDMQAGFFPEDWFYIMINKGTSWGFQYGWLIIALSVPYNLLGIIVCFFLTRKGAIRFIK